MGVFDPALQSQELTPDIERSAIAENCSTSFPLSLCLETSRFVMSVPIGNDWNLCHQAKNNLAKSVNVGGPGLFSVMDHGARRWLPVALTLAD
jgi:hypothetical protein